MNLPSYLDCNVYLYADDVRTVEHANLIGCPTAKLIEERNACVVATFQSLFVAHTTSHMWDEGFSYQDITKRDRDK